MAKPKVRDHLSKVKEAQKIYDSKTTPPLSAIRPSCSMATGPSPSFLSQEIISPVSAIRPSCSMATGPSPLFLSQEIISPVPFNPMLVQHYLWRIDASTRMIILSEVKYSEMG